MEIIAIMMLLLFTYVLVGALEGSTQTSGAAEVNVNHVNYVLLGILMMAIAAMLPVVSAFAGNQPMISIMDSIRELLSNQSD
jgi:sulfite exporter TauE/SafE